MSTDTIDKPWGEAEVHDLVMFKKMGFSASEIANKLGSDRTRNMVLGKLNRLGLSKPVVRYDDGTRKPRNKPSRAEGVRKAPSLPALRGLTISKPPRFIKPLPPAPPDPSGHVTITALLPDMCKWPIGDPARPDFVYCGGERDKTRRQGNCPYCAYHAEIAYYPPPNRMMRAETNTQPLRLQHMGGRSK